MFRPPRGTRDIVPPDSFVFSKVLSIAWKVFARFGFEPMFSPSFEALELLESKGGGGVREEIYYFQDKSGRWLGLRFDHTLGLARFAASKKNLKLPFKRFTFGPVWRYEEVKSRERWREFWQADVDILGIKSVEADAECVLAVSTVLEELGLKSFVVKVNNRKILKAFFGEETESEERFLAACRAVDKIEKKPLVEVEKEMLEAGLSHKTVKDFFRLTDNLRKVEEEEEKIDILERHFEEKERSIDSGFSETKEFLKILLDEGMNGKIKFDLTLARGLDYYTSLIFEFRLEKGGSSFAGGGRYDNLVEAIGGRPTPATGISIGVSRLASLLIQKRIISLPKTGVSVLVIPVAKEFRKFARKVTYKLRRKGISADFDLQERSFSTQLERCLKMGVKFAVFLGEKEIREGVIRLKDLQTREERHMTLDEAAGTIKQKT